MRYVPGRPLPAQAYIPGSTPRPERTHERAPFDAAAWRECETYLWGFDLLAGGFPWEAHEAWESLWRTLDRASTAALLLQGLIKLAAAQVKARQARPRSVRVHAEAAALLFRGLATALAPERALMGVDLQRAAACADALPHDPGASAPIELVGL